ncbi:MFS transporter [Burkholderia sp. L27(2015)]|uniref:MFS transporter n=1 Tax=Burkholderia sp. L27(2015) TaxID=1641858 RepID=UPI00131E635E|nr:MFS transporter [Burkholderia sp. L27(2015)]
MVGTLFYDRRFVTLLFGNLLSKVGDGVHELIFIVLALKVTNNAIAMTGFIYFFRFIPYLILGPIGGSLSDRVSRKLLMLTADIVRMIVTSAFCALLAVGRADPISLAVYGMLMTAFRSIFQPAFQAAIPSLVQAKALPVANGATQIVAEFGGLVGPAVGGMALALIENPGYVLILDSVTYLLSAMCIVAVRIPIEHRLESLSTRIRMGSLYHEFWRNLLGVIAKRHLFITIAYSSACILFVAAALRILIPAMMKSAGYSDSMIGYAMSLTALGTIAGAVLCARVARDFSTTSLMAYWCLYGLVLSMLPACIAHAFALLIGCVVLGIFGAFVDVVLPTNIQRLSTTGDIGKNFGLFSTLANTGEALSGSFAGLLVLVSSVGASITLIGLLVASVAYVGKVKSARSHG